MTRPNQRVPRPRGRPINDAGRWIRRGGFVALGLAVALTLTGVASSNRLGFDLAAYVFAARRLLTGEPLYRLDEAVPGPFGRYFASPIAAIAFIPLAALPPWVAVTLWMLLLVAVAMAVGVALVRPLPPYLRPGAAALFVAFLPLGSEIMFGNVSLVSLALALAAWRCRDRPPLAGGLLTCALALKPLPLVVFAFYAAQRRLRVLAWSAATAIIAVVITWPILGPAWIDFARLAAAVASAEPGVGTNIVPLALADSPARYLLPALALACAGGAGLIAHRDRAREGRAHAFALAAAPLLSATIWYPYLIFALPLLLVPPQITARATPGILEYTGRLLPWLVMETQFLREPGRDFIAPFFGLLLLLTLGARALLSKDRT